MDQESTRGKWAHATNSQVKLTQALLQSGDVTMIEADVGIGTVSGSGDGQKVPIMVHPPHEESDLALADFMFQVDRATRSEHHIATIIKVVKLDFKSIEAVEQSMTVLKAALAGDRPGQPPYSLWLNADILEGPCSHSRKPVDPTRFLNLCRVNFPEATLSPGFTTGLPDQPDDPLSQYTWEQVKLMKSTLEQHNCIKTQLITFPMRANLSSNSVDQLIWLLNQINRSTLTLWGSDSLSRGQLDNLRILMEKAGQDKVYLDLPDDISSQLLS